MKQDHQTTFGRQISAVLMKPDAPAGDLADKWQLLTALTQAAEDFGLNHRTLSVLRALLSFHPDRMICTTSHSSIVFPANRTLSTRLGGMPESTLRRHLAALVAAGIVSRHDSANRKRYARGRAGDGRIAFGFDLSPMARLAAQIAACAQAAQDRRHAAQSLRAELAALRQEVIALHGDTHQTDEAFRLLRRKPDLAALSATISALEDLLNAEIPSTTDGENERHIQPEFKIYSEKKSDIERMGTNDTPSFDAVVSQCTEYLIFFPEPARNWQDLSRTAYALVPMIGIEHPVYAQAIQMMGPKRAIIAVLCVLESLGKIGNPGGYLRRLIQKDIEGQLNMARLLLHAGQGELSADNHKLHLKTDC